jgi:hypothetical protein
LIVYLADYGPDFIDLQFRCAPLPPVSLAFVRVHPEMVLLPNLCVNWRPCLCDALQYVSAQALDFLDLEQNPSFPIWKLHLCPSGISGWTPVRSKDARQIAWIGEAAHRCFQERSIFQKGCKKSM